MRSSGKKSSRIERLLSTPKIQYGILLLIVLLAAFLRFVDYDNRWGLAYDQARDVIVVNEALRRMELPLIGPFSASGPFVFGPLWYWVYMLVISVAPKFMMAPWIFQTTVSALMPVGMFFIGKELKDKYLGFLLAFFTAISTAQIAQSTNLTYSTFVGFIAVFVYYFFIKAVKTKKAKYLYLLSFTVACAANIHFQAVGMIFLLPIALFLVRPSVIAIVTMSLIFVIPFIPLLIFDAISQNYQSKNIIHHFLIERGAPALPKRWLTYAGVTWQDVWSHVIGGHILLGYIFTVGTGLLVILSFIKKTITAPLLGITLFFTIIFVLFRYYGGSLFDAFYVFLHPVILIFSAWLCYSLYKLNKYVGLVLIAVAAVATLIKDHTEITAATNYSAIRAELFTEALVQQYPNEKFAIYDYKHRQTNFSFPFVMKLMYDDLIDDRGRKIGFKVATASADPRFAMHRRVHKGRTFEIIDLSASDSAALEKAGWRFINPGIVYDSIQKWYLKEAQE